MAAAINGDLSRRVELRADDLDWTPSPSGSVLRKRLHLVGEVESGQVTSIVRYEPDSSFPAHDHPDGEEILVLEGVFSDEQGDFPAGSYVLNPEGFRHAPFSRAGCLLFVKLRQYVGGDRRHVVVHGDVLDWQPDGAGVERKPLYGEQGYPETARLERWSPGASPSARTFAGGAEILVTSGALRLASGDYPALSWIRIPPGGALDASSPDGCELFLKQDGVATLRSAC